MRQILGLFIVGVILSSTTLFSQVLTSAKQTIATGGGTARSGSITLNYTLGQVGGLGATVSQSFAVQQGFQTGQVSYDGPATEKPDVVSVFPNPVFDKKVTIRWTGKQSESVQLSLYDLNGKLLERQNHVVTEDIITAFTNAKRGVYQLIITGLDGQFTITKTLIFL